MFSGISDYLQDPTGMNSYRSGLRQQEQAQREERQRTWDRVEGLGDRTQGTYNQSADMYSPLSQLVPQGVQGLQQDYSVTPQDYQFQGQVSDYLDPSLEFQQQQVQRGMESSAAARGNLMSGAAQKAIADRAQQMGQQGWADARSAMERDRAYGAGQAQQNYQNQVSQGQQQFNQANNLMNYGIQGLSGQTQNMNQGANAYANTVAPSYGMEINPTAGLANMAAGQMRGNFTQGLMDKGAETIQSLIKGGL